MEEALKQAMGGGNNIEPTQGWLLGQAMKVALELGKDVLEWTMTAMMDQIGEGELDQESQHYK